MPDYDVHFGPVTEQPFDWRTLPDNSEDDDGQLAVTPVDVKELLGFDPAIPDVEKAFNPNQARVPAGQPGGGQWTDGGGGGLSRGVSPQANLVGYAPMPAKSATELFERTYDKSITAEDVVNAIPGARQAILEAERKTAAGVQTQQLHMAADGHYSVDRVAVHDRIISQIINPETVAAALPEEGQQPTFVVLGGRGGAGKSWFTRSSDSPIEAENFLYLNSDDIKEALPEYEGWNAGLVHEESSDIVGRANHIARSVGANVIFDATMRSTGTIDRLVEEYKAAGYRVEGYFMHTAPQVSAVRAMNRFMSSGRYVPPAYVLSSVTNERSFDALAPKMDNWAVYDNNSSSGPTLIVRKE